MSTRLRRGIFTPNDDKDKDQRRADSDKAVNTSVWMWNKHHAILSLRYWYIRTGALKSRRSARSFSDLASGRKLGMRLGARPEVIVPLPVSGILRPEASFALTERCLLRARSRRAAICARAYSRLTGVSGSIPEESEVRCSISERSGTRLDVVCETCGSLSAGLDDLISAGGLETLGRSNAPSAWATWAVRESLVNLE